MRIRRSAVNMPQVPEASWSHFEDAVLQSQSLPDELRSRIAAALQAGRLGSVPSGNGWLPDVVPLVAGAVAPLFVAFVAWSMERARQSGIRRLYFVARDGQVLYRIAQEIQPHEDTLELSYLYGSRQAWYLPSVERIDRTDLHFIMARANSLAVRDNLYKLHIHPEDIAPELALHGFEPETWEQQLGLDQCDSFWDVLAEPRVSDLVIKNRDRARRIATEYLAQEGLLEDQRWALVDIGWNLTAQKALRRILVAGGQDHTLGYYLALGHNRTPPSEHGVAEGMLVEERDYGPRYPGRATIFDNKGFIDQMFTVADHGRTLGYEHSGGRVMPVLDHAESIPQHDAFLSTVQTTMLSVAREIARSGLAADHVPELVSSGRAAVERLVAEPSRSEAGALGWFPIVYDPNDVEQRTVPLAVPITNRTLGRIACRVVRRVLRGGRLTAAPYATPSALTRDLSWGFAWLDGAAALSRLPARLAVRVFKLFNRWVCVRRQAA